MIPRLDGGVGWAYLEPVWLSWKHHGAPAVFWICSLRMRMLCRCSGGNMAICSGVSCRTCIMRAAWRTHTEKEGGWILHPTHPDTHTGGSSTWNYNPRCASLVLMFHKYSVGCTIKETNAGYKKAFLSAPAIVSSLGLFSTLWPPHRRCYAGWLSVWLFVLCRKEHTPSPDPVMKPGSGLDWSLLLTGEPKASLDPGSQNQSSVTSQTTKIYTNLFYLLFRNENTWRRESSKYLKIKVSWKWYWGDRGFPKQDLFPLAAQLPEAEWQQVE